ncbi:MAG: hypothetical protein WKF91_09670 [Segetibacter sp.]
MSNQPFFDIPNVLSISGNRIVVRKYFEEFSRGKKKSLLQISNEENLKCNSPKGVITRKVRMKMRGIITNWIEALKYSPKAENGHKVYQATFVTLTLPAKQVHTDKEINAQGLNTFITKIKRSHKVINYVWRAEKQDNGNIHYHIITDKYISHDCIRSHWNATIKKIGYIDQYKKNQELRHKEGFQCNNELLNKWPIEKQFEAYQKGKANNWENPNTTDIHSLRSVKDVASYICKYITKSKEVDELRKLEMASAAKQITEEVFIKCKEEIEKKIELKKINSRLWGCSDTLKELKDVKIIVDYETSVFIEEVISKDSTRVVQTENFLIAYCNTLPQIIRNNKFINDQFQSHQRANFFYIYPRLKPKLKEVIYKPPDLCITEIIEEARQAVLF